MASRPIIWAALVAAIAIAAGFVAGGPRGAAAADSCAVIGGESVSFGFTGGTQSVQVPTGVVKAAITVRGGHGGQTGSTAAGGHGGLIAGNVEVSSGQCLQVAVGGYGGGDRWGAGTGGSRGTQWGPAYDGSGGGGSSSVSVDGDTVIVAGGGGGGGGNGQVYWNGGAGGDGAWGTGANTLGGAQGANGQGVPSAWYIDLGGMGGSESGPDGQGGYDGTTDIFSGAGGGGGGGHHGGGGGANWNGTAQNNLEKPVGGGGGGGGDSWIAGSVTGAQIAVDDGACPTGGGSDLCDGLVTIGWTEQPTNVNAYAGAGQSTPITTRFANVFEARVTSASGEPVAGVAVTFELPTSSAGGTFAVPGDPSQVTAATNANGIAASPAIDADGTAGFWAARASADSVATPALFQMENAPASTATAIYSTPEPSRSGEPVTLAAVVGAAPASAGVPTGNVDFEVDGASLGAPVPVNADGIAFSGPVTMAGGNHTVSAVFQGSNDFAGSSNSASHQVAKGAARVTVSTAPDPSAEGETVDVTAAVSALPPATGQPTGELQFTVDEADSGPPVPLTAGVANAQVALPTAGQHVIRALYRGDTNFAAGAGVTVQSVGAEATATTLTSSDPAPVYGAPLTFTAAVDGPVPPVGDVTFSAAGPGLDLFEICTQVTLVSGQAECEVDPSLATGDYEILAEFDPGSAGMEPSADRLSQHVREGTVAVDLEANPDPVRFGAGYGLDASVEPVPAGTGQLSGAVAFSVAGATVGDPVPLEQGGASVPPTATPALPAGPHPIGARYGGDRDFRDQSTASVISVDPVGTETTLSSSSDPAPFGEPIEISAQVRSVEPVPGPVEGAIQFWADGADRGDPVPLADGIASSRLTGLAPGDHDLRAYFVNSSDLLPSEARIVQTVDSPPPDPIGILPCADRGIVLTAAYRFKNSVRLEGVARYSLRGMRVKITTGGEVISQATVRPDGTFWAGARDPGGRRYSLGTHFQANANGHRSWARRLSQAITIRERRPWGTKRRGKSPRIVVRVSGGGKRRLTLARQNGCHKRNAKPVKRVFTARNGVGDIALSRPAKGRPYAIYRIRTGGGKKVSSPIIVRPAR